MNRLLHRPVARLSLPLAVTASLVLAACGGETADDAADLAAATPEASDEASPVSQGERTVTNCDREISFDGPPERVVTLDPYMTDLLVELGVGDAIEGRSNTDLNPPADELAAEVDEIPVLSSGVPSAEVLVAAEPDLIVADGEYWFDGERVATMEDLAADGVPVYINSAYCFGDSTSGTVEDVLTDLDALGVLFGVEDRATELAEDTTARLAALEDRVADEEPVPTAIVEVFEGQVYALARGTFSSVIEAGGGVNVFEDDLPADAYFGEVSTEVLLQKAPEVILVSFVGTDAELQELVTDLEGSLAATPAVQNGRVHAFSKRYTVGTLGSIDGAEEVAELLHGDA